MEGAAASFQINAAPKFLAQTLTAGRWWKSKHCAFLLSPEARILMKSPVGHPPQALVAERGKSRSRLQ